MGFNVSAAPSGWTESTINFSNAPAVGTLLGQSGPVTSGQWIDVHLPASAFSGGNGSYTLALDGLSSTTLSLASKEDVAGHKPQLLLDTGTGGGGTTNRPPSAGPVSLSATEDGGPSSWMPVVTDPDGPTGLTCSIATAPAHGTASVAPNCSTGSYSPAPNFNGSDPFVYRVSDGSLTADGTVTTTVTAVNDAPVAATGTASTTAGTPVTVGLSASDVDGTCALTFSVSTGPSHGSLGSISPTGCAGGTATANVVYTPTAGYTGPDTFAVVANDGTASSAAAQISVGVAAAQTSFPITASEDAYVVSTSPSTDFRHFHPAEGRQLSRHPLVPAVPGHGGDRHRRLGDPAHLRHRPQQRRVEGTRGRPAGPRAPSPTTTPPHPGLLLNSSGPVTTGTWVDVPVTAVVTGNGEVNLVLVPVNGTNLPFAARQTTTPPQLLIQTG